MACRMCNERGKTWSGSAPRCAFQNDGVFSKDNWNCATCNAIRDLISQDDEDERPLSISHLWADDQNYAIIDSGYINNGGDDGPEDMGTRFSGPLYVEWYKHRGATDRMFIMDDVPAPPTEAQCIRLLKYYEETKRRTR